jgi:ABC-type antimicrobial peptide transport system permease subunit
VYDYYNNNGVTEGDVNMISSMGSFIFIQMVLLLAIAVMMTVEYTKLRKHLPLAGTLSPVEKHMSDYSLVQLICGYIGVLGGIVIGTVMRTSRPDSK